jgi:peptidoglycan/LPS O-acetylase OafA/YrhL
MTPPAPAIAPAGRDRSIDVARMVAAGLIVAYHAATYHAAMLQGSGQPVPTYGGNNAIDIIGTISFWGRVPFFFFLSGCFAARSLSKPAASTPEFLKKRFELLGLPYLFWNVVAFVMVYLAARRGAELATTRAFTPATILMQLSGFGMSPVNSPLWFIRDLLLASCLAPLMLRAGKCLLFPCLALILFEEVPPDPARMAWPLASSFGYFGLGMLLNFIPAGTFGRFFPRPGVSLLLTVLLGLAFLVLHHPVPPLVGPAIGAAQILLAGCFINTAFPRAAAWLGSRANASFMIFASNVPFFAVVRQVYLKLPPGVPSGLFFAASAVVLFFMAILLHQFLRDRCPRLLKPLTGGR